MSVGEMVIAAFWFFVFVWRQRDVFVCLHDQKKKALCRNPPKMRYISRPKGIEAYKQEKKRGDIVFS